MAGPQLYYTAEQPYYRTGLIANMVCMIVMTGVVIIQVFYLAYLNRRNSKRRAALGRTAVHVDYSLVAASKWAEMKAAAKNVEGGSEEQVNEHAFEDLTDLNNVDFVYGL